MRSLREVPDQEVSDILEGIWLRPFRYCNPVEDCDHMECSEPTLLELKLVCLMDVWEMKNPKVLYEEIRHRWRVLEEVEEGRTWRHAVARG